MKEVLFEHRKQMYIISNICDTIPVPWCYIGGCPVFNSRLPHWFACLPAFVGGVVAQNNLCDDWDSRLPLPGSCCANALFRGPVY